MTGSRRVVLVSHHYYASRRRAGFHFLADSYARMGWDVVFVTAPLSWISKFGGDSRFEYPVRSQAGTLVPVAPGIRSYVHFTPFHPANLRTSALNALSGPIFRWGYPRLPLGPLADELRAADLLVFESTPALLLVDRFKALAPNARIVYRVSDDMTFLGYHPIVRQLEQRLAARCDLISIPSAYVHGRFAHLSQARLHGHALDKSGYDQPLDNPYSGGPNALFVGFWPLDIAFLRTAARSHPHVTFHVIGQRIEVAEQNIVSYDEMPFRETLPFVKHADIGLHTIAHGPGVESLRDSLKVIQFSYCGKPIIVPSYLASSRPNVVSYRPGDDEDAARAIATALAMKVEPATDIPSWGELARALAEDGAGEGVSRTV